MDEKASALFINKVKLFAYSGGLTVITRREEESEYESF